MRKSLSFLTALLLLLVADTITAQSVYDLNKPFGFATRSSRTDATAIYDVTGGGTFTYPVEGITSVITLTSTGKDMITEMQNAIKNYNVIIFDGSKGDFLMSGFLSFSSLKNKTLLGINNARLCTQWYVTQDIKDLLDAAGVKNMSSSSGGGTLVNGTKVTEEAEYNTRRLLIEYTGDQGEAYRKAGILKFSNCQNIIIRNLQFVGPGSLDVGGNDLLGLKGCSNMWVDHCDFIDGLDGNLDITNQSDFCTVSWCTFSYTERAYSHQFCNLIGSSDSETKGYLNITFAFNTWGQQCRARMPMVRVGKIHMLNNYYNCAGNASACINPRINSEVLIEGNYFASGVKKLFSQNSATAYVWDSSNIIASGASTPSSKGSVTMPYSYTKIEAALVPEVVGTYSGATLFGNKDADPTEKPDIPTPEDPIPPTPDDDTPDTPSTDTPTAAAGNTYIVDGNETTYDGNKIVLHDITMTYGNDGAWKESVSDTNAPEGYGHYITGSNNAKDSGGKNFSSSGNVPVKGTYYIFTPTKNGTLNMAVDIYMGKPLYVTENGKAITVSVNGKQMSPGAVANSSANTYGFITFPLEAGSTYYVFCESSKLMLFGFAFTPEVLLGDADGDGVITMADANLVVNEYLGINTDFIYQTNADTDGDGSITMADANGIVNLYLGAE